MRLLPENVPLTGRQYTDHEACPAGSKTLWLLTTRIRPTADRGAGAGPFRHAELGGWAFYAQPPAKKQQFRLRLF